ncbi:GntR family transcriptional regulator [Pelagibius sp.]|uniref:GntR family transcriptional regulator n=1 Tax=Pelagibius sp. TaxID=1931238 RepID=UPI0026222B4B|nr:GntR family transcriptional regulator [Pelagibius sp.]
MPTSKTERRWSRLPETASPLPLYHQMYIVLRQQLVEGAFGADEPMPSEHELARMFKVSRITVRRALATLEREGMIERHRGRGTFPTRRAGGQQPLRSNMRGLLENLLAMGLSTTVRVIDFGYVQAPDDVAEALALPFGATVQKAIRVRSIKSRPMSHLTTWVPEDIGRGYAKKDLAERPLLALLEEGGIKVSSAEQTVTARAADSTIADLLKTQVGLPLLAISRIVFDQDDRPVEFINALYRPDVYEYRMTMSRNTGGDAPVWEPTG